MSSGAASSSSGEVRRRWWGWGVESHVVPDATLAFAETSLGALLGASLARRDPPRIDQVAIAAPRFELPASLAHLGSSARYDRLNHALGKSSRDIARAILGRVPHPPDVVAFPRSEEDVVNLLDYATRERVAVVPYGGGSSVAGGVEPRCDGFERTLSMDLTRMDTLLELDERSRAARIQGGALGPRVEEQLRPHGLTLRHFPQSFEFSTLGGWIAARGAGQQSNRYGKAEKWLLGAKLATPRGAWTTEQFPASAAGPNMNQLVVGSEGTLGIIAEATVRVHPVPEVKDYRGYLFKNFASGAAAVREIVQRGIPVAMLRLSDPDETRFLQGFSGVQHPPGQVTKIGSRLVAWRGYAEERCLLLVGLEGERDVVFESRVATHCACDRNGGFALGRGTGRRWFVNRFKMPYLRDPLLDRGVAVETLETSVRWANLPGLYEDLGAALREALSQQAADAEARAIVMAHISHVYEDGASLYFTMVFPQKRGDTPLATASAAAEQWSTVKKAACEAIVAGGGTISHHHGVGTDHAPWMAQEKGPIGFDLLTVLKDRVDPRGVLNPGKLTTGS